MTTTFTTLENLATVKESIGTPKRYGFIIDQSVTNSTDCVSYIYDAYGMIPAGLDANNVFQYGSWKDFCDDINYPVMLAADGTELYRLDPEDQTKRIDGEAVDYTDGNMMAAFKRLWLSITQDGSKIKVVFCTERLDPTYQAEAFYNEYGELKDIIYHSMFNCTGSSSQPIKSSVNLSPTRDITIADFRTACSNTGSAWRAPSYAFRIYLAMLHTLISKCVECNYSFGRGHAASSPITSGSLVSTGGFAGTRVDSMHAVKSFYVENLWGNVPTLCEGFNCKDDYYWIKSRPPYSTDTSDLYGFKKCGGVLDGMLVALTAQDGLVYPSAVSNASEDQLYYAYTGGTYIHTADNMFAGGTGTDNSNNSLWTFYSSTASMGIHVLAYA